MAPRGIRIGGVIGRIGLGDSIHRPDDAFDDVIDIREVAFVGSVVEDVDRAAFENRLGELEERHVRAAPWAIDVEEPKSCARETEEVGIGVRHQLGGSLGGRIDVEGMIRDLIGPERQARARPIDRRRRRVHQMRHLVVPAPFENVKRADQIGMGVDIWSLDGMAHACLSAQVNDSINTMAREDPLHRLTIGQVGFDECESRPRV